MADETLDLKAVPRNEPSTTTGFVSDGASLFRQLKKALWKYETSEHNEDGLHYYGVPITGDSATTLVVDVGQADQLQVLGLYAGLSVKVRVGNTSTGNATLLVKSNTTSIGTAKSIKFAGSTTLAAGLLVANAITEFVYDGTNWLLMSGGVGVGTIPLGTMVRIASSDVATAEITDTTPADFVSLNTGLIVFSLLLLEVEFYFQSTSGNSRNCDCDIVLNGSTVKANNIAIVANADGSSSITRSSVIVPWQSNKEAHLSAQVSAANCGVTINNFRLWGIK